MDFAGEGLGAQSAMRLIDKSRFNIEKNIIQLLGRGQFRWKYPTDSGQHRIFIYWLSFQPPGMRQRYRVKMEFASYPVYQVKIIPVKSDFDIMQRRPLVNGLMPHELMAEKITAVVGRPYTKERDIFDLWFLSEVLDQNIDISLVEKKFNDYNISWNQSNIKQKLEHIKSINLEAEMKRFLPQRFRHQLSLDDYAMMRWSALAVIDDVAKDLSTRELRK